MILLGKMLLMKSLNFNSFCRCQERSHKLRAFAKGLKNKLVEGFKDIKQTYDALI